MVCAYVLAYVWAYVWAYVHGLDLSFLFFARTWHLHSAVGLRFTLLSVAEVGAVS